MRQSSFYYYTGCALLFASLSAAASQQTSSIISDFNENNSNKFVNQRMYESITANTKAWIPYTPENHPFKGLTEEQIKNRMGLRMSDNNRGPQAINNMFNEVNKLISENFGFDLKDFGKAFGNLLPQPQQPRSSVTLPNSFDARSKPSWAGCIHSVRDQGSCGSCWAFASAAFLEDRLCIASNKAINVRLSPQDMVDCDYSNGGCGGGFLAPSLTYLLGEGLVTETCLPYKEQMNPICTYRCDNSNTQYKKYACKVGSMKIATTTEEIMTDLITNGPMMVGFTIYNDFMSYASGIYEPTTNQIAGAHAVKLLGWDRDGAGKLFWICQNQWGTNWGDAGYFKIYAGKAGLDSAGFACLPDL